LVAFVKNSDSDRFNFPDFLWMLPGILGILYWGLAKAYVPG
jgi:hypothetical protein